LHRRSEDFAAAHGRSPGPHTWPLGPVAFLLVCIGYLALAQVTIFLNDPVMAGASFWPAAGLTMGALLLLPTRCWGWVIAAIAVAEFGGDMAHGYPLVASLWWTLGNCVEPLLGAALIRRYTNHAGALVPVNNLLGFLLFGVVIAPVVGASIGTMGSVLSVGNPFWQVWPKYVIGDALGVLVVAPLLLTWREPRIRRWPLETALLSGSLLLVTLLAFRNWPGEMLDIILPYLVVPVLSWAALRYGVRGVALAVVVMANGANIATALGYGPFSMASEYTGHAVTLLQIFLAITTSTALLLAALVNDLRNRIRIETLLKHQVMHDPLTGVSNRLGLLERFEGLRRSSDQNRRISLLLCDLDDFKCINDTLGHLAGDEVLVEVGKRMRGTVRADNLVARIGGDEFVIMVDNQDDRLILAMAERLLLELAEPIKGSSATMRTSVSIGIAHGAPSREPDATLREADIALYEAKRLGRGRVVEFAEHLRFSGQAPSQAPSEMTP